VEAEGRYGIEELASLGGVSRRTVRYYVREGLLPAPLGLGRGRHYDATHLERLLRVKTLQERGLSLDEVRRDLERGDGRDVAAELSMAPAAPRVNRSAWTRLEILPGVELHLSGRYRLPSPRRLEDLLEWCRTHLRPEGGPGGE
jgi:DNA-binding transcriptional MerR regulator